MTYRELLELAAKAAGVWSEYPDYSECITDFDSPHYGEPALHRRGIGVQCFSWNPLTDDGDAFRLAVKLRFTVKIADHEVEVFDVDGECLVSIPVFDQGIDNVSGTVRRAITRAAAEIGRKK